MKILYISVTGTLGGAERCLLTAMNAVKRLGHDVHLISCTDGPLLNSAATLNITTQVVPMPPLMSVAGESGGALGALWRGLLMLPAAWRYIRRLRKTIAAIAPDVIHSNGLKVNVLLSLARPAAPVVWHLHDFLASRRLMAKLLRGCARRAARAIAISQAVADDARPILAPLPIDIVMNAIDVERFSPTGPIADLDHLAGLSPPPPNTLRIGLVATYAKWKGHDLFLRAAANLLKDNPALPVRFHIIGGPIYHTAGSQWSREDLAYLAKQLNIADHVALVPFQPDTPSIYRALDIVVHASTKPEPFGLTIVEAMACARPVIVSAAGGAAELFTDGTDALAFPPNDESALSQQMLELVTHPDRRTTLAQAARTRAVTHFSDTRYGPQLISVYQNTK